MGMVSQVPGMFVPEGLPELREALKAELTFMKANNDSSWDVLAGGILVKLAERGVRLVKNHPGGGVSTSANEDTISSRQGGDDAHQDQQCPEDSGD